MNMKKVTTVNITMTGDDLDLLVSEIKFLLKDSGTMPSIIEEFLDTVEDY